MVPEAPLPSAPQVPTADTPLLLVGVEEVTRALLAETEALWDCEEADSIWVIPVLVSFPMEADLGLLLLHDVLLEPLSVSPQPAAGAVQLVS